MVHSVSRAALAIFVVGALVSCGGGSSSPTGGTPTPPPTTLAPTPTPTPTPPPSTGSSTCALGKGTADTSCHKSTNNFGQQVDDAIELLVRQRPELFDLTDQRGPGGYLVKDFDAYYAGVVKNLQALPGVCAGFDFEFLNVKNTNEFSEQFDVLASSGHARRGASAYQGSCFPANFPVDPKDVIAYVRVAFFGFQCDPGVVPPPNPLGKLPQGCVGFVTATPKDKDGVDVDPRIHGQEIAWLLTEGKGVVDTHHVDGQPFNWELQPLRLGAFQFCATLQGVTGCLNGEVIPNPTQ
jgi:hypothetical protein